LKKDILRIGNASAFWGDSPHAPANLVGQQPDLDYLTLDYLAEVSMSIMAIQREKDPSKGYAEDFVNVVSSLIPFWQKGSLLKVITNAGGLNPHACAKACAQILSQAGCNHLKIGVVAGDDVLLILRNQDQPSFNNLETNEPLKKNRKNLVSANAYLGAKPIAEALQRSADIVITGRVADPSLTVGPCVAHFKWEWDDYDRIAAATIAGHLIECGTQVTGGISTRWMELPDPATIGFPVVEMSSDGSFVITKPQQTGGRVTEETVKEQLLYEIGDPDQYISPDAIVSFLSLTLQKEGKDRIKISGAKGRAPPSTYKVSATYRDGFKAEAMLGIYGQESAKKARLCGEIILSKVRKAGYEIERFHLECLGQGDIVPGVLHIPSPPALKECILRICVSDHRKEALECFSKEIASLVTCGPQGVVGYTIGRPKCRPIFGYWPCLIDNSHVKPCVEVLSI